MIDKGDQIKNFYNVNRSQHRASDRSRKIKSNFVGFSEKNSRKNTVDFAGISPSNDR